VDASIKGLTALSAAIFAGGAFYISLVEHPARMKAGISVALAEFREMYRLAAPWQASAAAISFLAGALASSLSREWEWSIGGLLVGLAVPFTLIFMMPTNRRLLDTRLLADGEAAALLRRWGRLHWVRSALATLLIVLLMRAIR
jgi:hypothetical protein